MFVILTYMFWLIQICWRLATYACNHAKSSLFYLKFNNYDFCVSAFITTHNNLVCCASELEFSRIQVLQKYDNYYITITFNIRLTWPSNVHLLFFRMFALWWCWQCRLCHYSTWISSLSSFVKADKSCATTRSHWGTSREKDMVLIDLCVVFWEYSEGHLLLHLLLIGISFSDINTSGCIENKIQAQRGNNRFDLFTRVCDFVYFTLHRHLIERNNALLACLPKDTSNVWLCGTSADTITEPGTWGQWML